MRKNTLLTSTGLASTGIAGLLAGSPAWAQPLMSYSATNTMAWSGLYFGVNAGYGWAANAGTECVGLPGQPCGTTAFPAAKPSGGAFGGQVGYNWQLSSNLVFGIETDMAVSAMRDTTQFSGIDPSKGPDQLTSRYDWLGTTRGRVGVLTGPAMFYATGGLAYGFVRNQYEYGLGDSTETQFFSSDGTRMGWSAGGGVEYAFDKNWSMKAEYLYVQLAKSNLDISSLEAKDSGPNPPGTNVLHFRNDMNLLRLGLNYRF